MFPLIQSPGTLPDWHDFSSITESGLAIASANSLRTLGFISSGSMDFWMFRFLRWSQAQSSFTAGGTLLPQSLPWEVWEERFVSVDWGKPTGPQASPSLLLSISQLCLSEEYAFFDLSFFGWNTCRISYCSFPCQVQLQPSLGLSDPIPTQPGSIPIAVFY